MNCNNCGTEIPENASKCPSCGTNVSPPPAEVQAGRGFAQTAQKLSRFSLYTSIPVFIFIILVEAFFAYMLVSHGYSILIILPFFLITFAAIFFTVYQTKKTTSVNVRLPAQTYKLEYDRKLAGSSRNSRPGQNMFGADDIHLEPVESIVDFISPVLRTNILGGQTLIGPSGVGTDRYPENTIILTNRRLIMMTSPMQGQGMVLGRIDIDAVNDVFYAKRVREVASAIVEELKNGGSQKPFPNDYWLDLSSITKSKFVRVRGPMAFANAGYVKLKTQSGSKFSYMIRDKEDFTRFSNAFNTQAGSAILR